MRARAASRQNSSYNWCVTVLDRGGGGGRTSPTARTQLHSVRDEEVSRALKRTERAWRGGGLSRECNLTVLELAG